MPNSQRRKGSTWTIVVAGLLLVGMGMMIAGMTGIGHAQSAQEMKKQGVANAQQLSATFREVAKATFPGIVAIETVGHVSATSQGLNLEDLFGGDPRFEQFFKNLPESRQFQKRQAPRQRTKRGQGSGFIISKEGYIITNNHVVSDADEVKVILHDGREFIADVIGVDSRSDVAVIKIDAPNLTAVPLGDSDDVEVGDFVLAFGNPFGLQSTMTQGIISAKGRGPGINEREDYLQTDAAINPGNSGGPLVNLNGEVIGINTAISSRSGGYDGVGFAIPANMARWVADQLREHGQVKRAYIGVSIQSIDNDLARQLGIGVNEGAIVTSVMPNSPSEKAGLEPGDVILELNGKAVGGTRQLQGIVEQLNVDKSYPLLVLRNGKQQRLNITMAEMPQSFTVADRFGSADSEEEKQTQSEGVSSTELGLHVQDLSNDLAEQLGYPTNVQGVIISSVVEGSPADTKGLREGEVIEKINQVEVKTVKDFEKAIEKIDADKGVLMLVRRGVATRFVVLKK